jgi:hypothetical protein
MRLTTGVVGVQFNPDGINFGSEDLSPYSIIWDTKTTSADDYNITAIARDAVETKLQVLGKCCS